MLLFSKMGMWVRSEETEQNSVFCAVGWVGSGASRGDVALSMLPRSRREQETEIPNHPDVCLGPDVGGLCQHFQPCLSQNALATDKDSSHFLFIATYPNGHCQRAASPGAYDIEAAQVLPTHRPR